MKCSDEKEETNFSSNPVRSYSATPMLSVVQINVKLNFIKHCSYCM